MPVLDQTTSNSYTGNGVTTVFAYTFKLLDQADVLVEVDGVAKTLTTHYTVSGVGNSGGGNITFLSAPANAAEVVIQRDMAYLRETDYQDNGDLLAATLDEDIDRVVMQGQQTRDGVDRAAKLPVTVSGVDPTLPVPVANRGLKWNAAADGFENGDSDLDAIEAAVAASAAAAAASQSAAASSQSSASASASSATASASTATTQAGIATTMAGEASASAAAALTSENNAETAETNAAASLADALAIYGSIVAVQSAASDAAASASAAQTAETNAETAETNAAASAAAAAASETAADSAYSSSIAIYGSLAAVQSAASSASASAVTAAAEADEATNQASAAAASALSAASVVSQDLSAIDKTVFAAAIVDTFLYDTEKDSDGGAWRKRCSHTPWENETLSGNWLGSAANEAAARAISGATTGSYYYDTTALGFYTLNAGSGKTATYRGNVRQFPAKVLITAEAARVVIWDLTQAGCPMWMVFPIATSVSISCVAMLNGLFVFGSNGATGYLWAWDFPSAKPRRWYVAGYQIGISWVTTIPAYVTFATPATVSNTVNDVAMTVLPTAQVDVATGLPVPTIAVATTGGVSVIKDDGTAVGHSTGSEFGLVRKIALDGKALWLRRERTDSSGYSHWGYIADVTAAATNGVSYSESSGYPSGTNYNYPVIGPQPAGDSTVIKVAGKKVAFATGHIAFGTQRLTILRPNPAVPGGGMAAYIAKDSNSGWLPGDVRGAWLADTAAETLTGTELVTNGDFATDTSGWAGGNATLSVVANAMRITASSSAVVTASQAITCVVGKTYVAQLVVVTDATGGTVYLVVGTSAGGAQTAASSGLTGTGRLFVSFIATATTHYLGAYGAGVLTGEYFDVDTISCRPGSMDRSVNGKGLQAIGSLTKAAAASGAALVGYSGFSAANYLEQAYNSGLDFGTGDFCIMGWLTEAPNSAIEYLFNRDSATPGKAIRLWVSVAGYLVLELYDGTTTRTATGTTAVDTSTRLFWMATYSAGTLTIYVNGVSYATATGAALLTLTNASAVTRVGLDVAGSYPATNANLALVRAGATVPSAEQIKHIYETEKALFEANAQCCLAGTSNSVTALAYDEETDLLHVGTSYGRSAFKGLVRVASEATPVGAITALAAGAGVVVQGGASGADVYVPAYTLREELLRDAEQMAKFGQNLVAHDFTATSSQTTFTLPVGWEIVAVYQQGAIKRETTSWTRSFDGFKWSVVLGTGATVSDWISILAKRV